MSVIGGFSSSNPSCIPKAIVERMGMSLKHRGPDIQDSYYRPGLGLYNCLLQTNKESLFERLPFYDREQDLIIVCDARIDNRSGLKRNLGIKEKEVPDSRLILNSYTKWGHQCAEKLLGDFSFVIWNNKDNSLFCARDHIGHNPSTIFGTANSLYSHQR